MNAKSLTLESSVEQNREGAYQHAACELEVSGELHSELVHAIEPLQKDGRALVVGVILNAAHPIKQQTSHSEQ
jgi:hypothetical protein